MSAAEEDPGDAPAAASSVSGESKIKSGYVDVKKMQDNSGVSSVFSSKVFGESFIFVLISMMWQKQ